MSTVLSVENQYRTPETVVFRVHGPERPETIPGKFIDMAILMPAAPKRGWLSQTKVEEPVNNIVLTHQAEA